MDTALDIAYIIAPTILIAVVLASVWLDRFSVPVILVALGTGILFGSDVLNVWHFEDVELTNRVANMALVFILFQGGFSTKRRDVQAVALPAGGLATWGVLLTAIATFAILRFALGWTPEISLLLAVILSSTDAAAIFSILRRQALPNRLSSIVEIESAANDPMAILLTLAAVEGLATGQSQGLAVIPLFLWKFTGGPLIGWIFGRLALWLFNRLDPQERGYYYVLLLGIVLLTYGVAERIEASGILAVFTTGFVMGNHRFIYKQGIHNFSAALATIANIGVFILMGLLVFPRQWSDLWLDGIILFLVITFISRPLAVWLGTPGMKLTHRDKLFASWAGLRGAVPIVLATYPLASGLPDGERVFNMVFFVVLLSVLVQGSTLGTIANWLKLATTARPAPRYSLELIAMAESPLDIMVVDLPDPQGHIGPRIRDLQLPEGAVIVLITRGDQVVMSKGQTHLCGWDRVTLLAPANEEPAVRSSLIAAFEKTIHPTPEG